jgi:uncharacterized protein YcfJ
MLKKLIGIALVLTLTGCATHQQANTAVGAGTGAIIGNAIGGRSGAAVGALIGASIGGQQPAHHGQTVYVERQVIVPNRSYQCQQYADRERNCWNMQYRDTRAICIEDARQHYQNCVNR